MLAVQAASAAGSQAKKSKRSGRKAKEKPSQPDSGRKGTGNEQPEQLENEPQETANETPRAASSSRARPHIGFPRTGSGIVLGIVAYCLFSNYINGGVDQVGGWLGAKLINKPYSKGSGPI